jgi:tRNA nucleotidyltransferase/poly(A) polymerase
MAIPSEIKNILKQFQDAGFEARIVGGCVRDLLLKRKPKDWDITTNAKPEEIQNLFSDSFYENKFGTVGIKTYSKDETLQVIEATTYRIEATYSDKRHPDKIEFSASL